MSNDKIRDRGKILEDLFFSRLDSNLIKQIRSDDVKKADVESLKEISGITDENVLQQLVEFGVSDETYRAVQLIPLILVAWADGELDPNERRAVLQAAQGNSIAQGSASHSLLENWLQQNPKDLDTAWFSFMESLIPILKPEDKESLRQTVVDGSIAVAESAGGLMGTFFTVCKEESELIERFKALFSK